MALAGLAGEHWPGHGIGAGKVEPHRQHHPGHKGNKGGLGELKAPARRIAGQAQAQQPRADRQEAEHHAGAVAGGMGADLRPSLAGQTREAQGLHRQDGEDAGHEVEDHPAQQGESQRLPERQDRGQRRHRAGGEVDAIGLANALAVGQGQHAFDLGGEGGGAAGQAQGYAVSLLRQGLGGGVVDEGGGGGEEKSISQAARGQGADFQRAGCAGEADAGGEGQGAGQRGLGGGEACGLAGGGAGSGLDWQGEGEAGLFGDADLGADQPIRLCDDGQALARAQAGGGGDGGQETGTVLVAEIHQRAIGDAAGGGELQRAGRGAFGKGPGDVGWRAGIAGVGPVDVPAAGENLLQRHAEGLAGGDCGGLAHQRGGAARRGEGLRHGHGR